MASRAYSFIDIAVLDAVRERFAGGEALAILDQDLEQIIWANGRGAALLGFEDVEAASGAHAELGSIARRQISGLPGFPSPVGSRSVAIRLNRGPVSQLETITIETVRLPGENAILISQPGAASKDPAAMLLGLAGDGQAAAILDPQALPLAATEGLAALEIPEEALLALVRDVRNEPDRLVKRRIAGGGGPYPAAVARLVDDPALHLLIVVGEPAERVAEESATASPAAAEEPILATPPAAEQEVAKTPPQGGSIGATVEMTEEPNQAASTKPGEALDGTRPSTGGTAGPEPSQFDEPEIWSELPGKEATVEPIKPDRQTTPMRFVWRTDADGRFSAVSEEFAQAVGALAADIVGRTFRDVATVFGLDQDGDIAELLERHDTWSGRTIWWPIAGADLQAPVDLAALPGYDRDRNFEGFRGFGVVRVADARPDPEKVGLSLTPGVRLEELAPPPAIAETEAASPAEATVDDDPFRGEVPALQITPAAAERGDGKVVRLAERRTSATEKHLSSIERQAFREIGERLRREQKAVPPDRDGATRRPDLEQTKPDPAPQDPVRTFREKAPAIADGAVVETLRDQLRETLEAPLSEATDADEQRDLQALDGPAETEEETIDREQAQPTSWDEPDFGGASVVAFGNHPGRVDRLATTDTSILDQLPVPVLIHSGDELHYANPEFLKLTGYESIGDLERAGGLDQLFVEPYENDAEERRELRMRTGTGEEFPAEAVLRTAPWAGGRALMLVVRQTGEAIAFGAPSNEDLRQRLAEMRAIIDTATDGVILVGSDGVIRSISHPAEALFGFDSDEVKGKPLVSLFDLESQGIVRDYLENLSLGGVASVLNDGREVVGREAQGRSVPLFMTMGRLPGEGGYCAVVRDITPWKKAEDELTKARSDAERASAQKSDFLARISHEIRTPLNAIIGFSELMVDEKFGPISNDRYRDYLRDINRSGNHVLDLVNDLLDLSKIEAGQQEMSYEAVSLNEALAEAVSIMQPQANRERVIIRSSFAPRLPDIVADLRSIRQIALNILSNAVRYTQAGGQVVISTAYENGSIAVRVRDTGVGMTQAELEQAMKPFQQLKALKRPRGDGTGLGLPLTKAMVEANRARFAISSKPGDGTLVEITFPSTRVLAQ